MKHSKLLFALLLLFSIETLLAQKEELVWESIEKKEMGRYSLFFNEKGKSLDGKYKISKQRGDYYIWQFKDGKKDGMCTDYDYKDRPLKAIEFKDGKPHGSYTLYHQNGKISKQGNFIDGEEEGKWESFDEQGSVKAVENYINGKKNGTCWKRSSRYSDSGMVTENYKNDKLFGAAYEKDQDGNIFWERNYESPDSYTEKTYHTNGHLHTVKTKKNGELDGEKLDYAINGVLIRQEIYDNGILQSKTEYYEDGKIRGSNKYTAQGIKIFSEYYTFYENGSKECRTRTFSSETGYNLTDFSTLNGKKHGFNTTYNKLGNVESQGWYVNGEKDGLWKHYNIGGRLIRKTEYDLGKIVSDQEYE